MALIISCETRGDWNGDNFVPRLFFFVHEKTDLLNEWGQCARNKTVNKSKVSLLQTSRFLPFIHIASF